MNQKVGFCLVLAIIPTVLASIGFSFPLALLEDVNVTGTWDIRVESPQGTGTPSVTLRQDGDRITGTYKGRMGETKVDGTIKGNEIKFAVNLNFQDQSITVTYTGTVDKDTMSGTAQFGDRGSANWTARRRRD